MNNFLFILFIALLVELITVIGRFGLHISMKDIWTGAMKKRGAKHWVHFHHAFFGIIVAIVALLIDTPLGVSLGLGIALSDIIHHALVLWPLTGSPEFHILYKNTQHQSYRRKKQKNVFTKHVIHHT
jgi:hypothetical protein